MVTLLYMYLDKKTNFKIQVVVLYKRNSYFVPSFKHVIENIAH